MGVAREIWSLRVDEMRDREGLRALDRELAAIEEAWARPLRFKVGARLAGLKRQAAEAGASGTTLAGAYGLPVPDGRRLHKYRLGDEVFGRLGSDLAARGDLAALEPGHWAGLFVLWASEWFRRSYRGGGHRWADLTSALDMAEDQARLRAIAAAGLKLWRRPVVRAGTAKEYLGSLALEGGFPTAAVEEGGRGWAAHVLGAIVAPLLGDPAAGEERARELAEGQRGTLPRLFRDDEFLALCADLALAIVGLRREADEAAARAGVPVIAWLELNRPGWRDRLPLTIGERTAEALIERLMAVESVNAAAVGVERLLAPDGAVWREAVRITLDGAVDGGTMRRIDPTEGRLRAFAAGEMARAVPGELAMLDPPAEGETGWMARATKRAKGVQLLPFAAAVELDLRAGEHRVAHIALPGGKPRRGALLVAVREAGSDEAPTLLRVVGSGSGQYRADMVFLRMPADWTATATAGEMAEPIGTGTGDTRLWRVVGGAFVTDPAGDRYRIRCGQPGDGANRIELVGATPRWAEVAGDIDLFVGAPVAHTSGSGGGALCIRAIGERGWHPAPRPLPVGHYELGWREDKILLDRRRVAVLPADAEIAQGGSPQQPHYALSGFTGCTVRPAVDAPVESTDEGRRWRARRTERAVHWFEAVIGWPDGPDLPVRIAFPCAASVARWDGRVLPNQARVTLGELRDLVAVNCGRVQLVGELCDRGDRRAAEMTWQVVDELPMASIAADIASMLLPASIDAEVRLGMHDGIETYWHVRQFAVELQRQGDGVVASRGVVAEGAELVGRSFADPAREVSFGPYSLLTDANHRPARPEGVGGDWLLYLRAGGTVLSRPLFFRGEGEAAPPVGRLAAAMLNPPGSALDRALLDLLSDACRDEASAAPVLEELLALACSLRGLPPATFRALELVVRRPGLLARMAVGAGPDERDAVIGLSDALPFAWCTLPRFHWLEAQRFAFERNLAALAPLGTEAPRYAKEALDVAVAKLIEREPLLGPVLAPGNAEPIEAVAQALMNRAADRVPRSAGGRYRNRLDIQLPNYFRRFDERYLDTLDAPCAAALAVVEAWTPQPKDVRHIKTVARNFPTFFADAFAAWLKDLKQ